MVKSPLWLTRGMTDLGLAPLFFSSPSIALHLETITFSLLDLLKFSFQISPIGRYGEVKKTLLISLTCESARVSEVKDQA